MEDREQVELFISCRSLKDMDVMSVSDPQVILMIQGANRQWAEYGKTEIIDNNLNPDFATSFPIDFIFEQQQHLKFKCVDIDGKNDYDFIGECETTLSKIVGSR
jgi:Ca2+-dependent lipid-binding protein